MRRQRRLARWPRPWVLAVFFAALVLGGCGVSAGDGSERGGQSVPEVGTTDEGEIDPLVGSWQTTTNDGTCGWLSPQTRVVRIEADPPSGEFPTVIEVSGNTCLADGAVAFSPQDVTDDGFEGEAFGGPLGLPETFDATLERVSENQFDLVVGTQRVPFTRASGPPEVDQEEESSLLGIPTPEEALTARNAGLAAVTTGVLLMLVSLPTTLLSGLVESSVDEARRSSAARWWRKMMRGPGAVPQRGFWQRWRGMAAATVASALVFSAMQPGWGTNVATAVTFLGFLTSLTINTGATMAMRWRFQDRRGLGGSSHPDVVPTTGLLAIGFALASRAMGFLPGYAYPIHVDYESDVAPSPAESGKLVARVTLMTFALALGGWLAIGPLDALPGETNVVRTIMTAVAGGLFTVGIDALVIGLLPLPMFPGHELRARRPKTWLISWLGGLFLFALVLLRPGLADAQTESTWVTIGFAVAFAVVVGVMWWRAGPGRRGGGAPPPQPPEPVAVGAASPPAPPSQRGQAF